jgi:hypothetical protein
MERGMVRFINQAFFSSRLGEFLSQISLVALSGLMISHPTTLSAVLIDLKAYSPIFST